MVVTRGDGIDRKIWVKWGWFLPLTWGSYGSDLVTRMIHGHSLGLHTHERGCYNQRVKQTPENVIPMTTTVGVVRGTGEVLDVEIPAKRGRRRNGRRKVYAMVDLEALDRLELSGQEWEVLTRLMRAVNQETNEARVGVTEIGMDLGIAPQSVSRAMRTLRERRIIETLRQGVHRVNSHIMYRGSNQDWDDATDLERMPLWRR